MSKHHRFLSLIGIIVILMLAMAAAAGGADEEGSGEGAAPLTEEVVEGTPDESQEVDDATEPTDEVVKDPGGDEKGDSAGQEASSKESGGSKDSQDDGVEPWVWVVILVVAIGAIGLVFLVGRNSGRSEPKAAAAPAGTHSAAERQQILVSTLTAWTSAGWMIESQSNDTAVLTKDGQRRQVTIDEYGRATQYELPPAGGPPSDPGGQPPATGGQPPATGAEPPPS